MPNHTPMAPLLAAPALLLLLACSTETDSPAAGVVVDTLPGGAVHVRTAAEGVWALTGAEPWQLVEELRIGLLEGDDRYVFGGVRNVIPDPMGRIWALDARAFELRLYDAQGRFVRAVGRQGDGPGEFSGNHCAFAGPDHEIWVEDAARRWQRLDTAGVLVGSFRSTSNVGCGIRRWTPDGRLLAVNSERVRPPAPRRSFFVEHRLSPEGELVVGDTFPVPDLAAGHTVTWTDGSSQPRFFMTLPIPFAHRSTWTMGPMGDFFVTDGGGPYRIRRQTLAGDTLVIMERPYEPVPVPDSIRQREIDEFRRDDMVSDPPFSADQVPRVYPPFNSYFMGIDGTVWVRRQSGERKPALDVFSPDGRFLGAADIPADFDRMGIHHAGEDYMYGVVRDELDIPSVVRLAIRRP